LDKIDVVFNGSKEIYSASTDEEILITKSKYTSGNDYFLFVGALSPRKNIANLLSAFEIFKEKTQSRFKLVIVGEKMFKTSTIKNVYSKMQYKSDVVFTGRKNPEELKKLYSSAYALTFVPYFEGFGIPIIEAMNCETAVITSNVTSMPEVAGDAALYIDPFSVSSIAQAMIKLFHEPEYRDTLIKKGKEQCKNFSWDKTADKFWKSIDKIINELIRMKIPGCAFRQHNFIPTFHKFEGEYCHGMQIHITDYNLYEPVYTAACIFKKIKDVSGRLEFKDPPYEYEEELMPFDILSGDNSLRMTISDNGSLNHLRERWRSDIEQFSMEFKDYLLYES